VRRSLGYLPQRAPLYTEMGVLEYLRFAADLRQLDASTFKKRAKEVVEVCGIAQVLGKEIRQLSHGYRQRVGLAQALIHDPPILILDEPTTGLDPNQIIEIRELIRSLGQRKTVVLSTHILQEVEAICSSVIILNEGRVAAQGSPSEIGETLKGEERIRLRLKSRRGADGSSSGGLDASRLSAIPGIRSVASFEPESEGVWAAEIAMPPAGGEGRSPSPEAGEIVFDWAVANGIKILELERRRLSLEEIFVKLTSEGEGR
jgi:ABC-2 type transport system ATP-binding protein